MEKTITVDFRVHKDIGESEFGIPTDMISFLELLEEATYTKEKLSWKIYGDEITFFVGDIEIGDINFWGPEDLND